MTKKEIANTLVLQLQAKANEVLFFAECIRKMQNKDFRYDNMNNYSIGLRRAKTEMYAIRELAKNAFNIELDVDADFNAYIV